MWFLHSQLMKMIKQHPKDIILKRGGSISQRPANRMYHELLKANVMLYKCVPKERRSEFALNIYIFVTKQLGRRFLVFNDDQYEVLTDLKVAAGKIGAAIRDDKNLKASMKSNPLAILGNHDPTAAHNGNPFVHLKADGTWVRVTKDQVQKILVEKPGGDALCQFLVLPAGVSFGYPPVSSTPTLDSLMSGKNSSMAGAIATELGFHDTGELKRALAALKNQTSVPADIIVQEASSVTEVSSSDESTPPRVQPSSIGLSTNMNRKRPHRTLHGSREEEEEPEPNLSGSSHRPFKQMNLGLGHPLDLSSLDEWEADFEQIPNLFLQEVNAVEM